MSSSTAYLYKVRSRDASNNTSGDSPPDPATTFIYTDTTLTGIAVKAVHFTELRTAIGTVARRMVFAIGLSHRKSRTNEEVARRAAFGTIRTYYRSSRAARVSR